MAFEIYSATRRSSEPYIAVDRQSRLRLSQGLREMLGCVYQAIELYIAYDKANKRIALAKPDIVRLPNVRPLRFDAKRGYAAGQGFLKKNRIPAEAHRYIYVGKEQGGNFRGWYVFQLENYAVPDDRLPE